MIRHKGKWQGVMLHHTATDQNKTPKDIRDMHLNKGWGDVGYHYLIKIYGDSVSIKYGRSDKYNGAHCDVGGYNSTHIGVAIIGNFEKDKLNKEQYISLLYAIYHIMCKYKVNNLIGHREAKATACPGKNIDIHQIRKDLGLV